MQMGTVSSRRHSTYVAAPDNAEGSQNSNKEKRRRNILTITGSRIGRAVCLCPQDLAGAHIKHRHVAILRPDLKQVRPEYLARFPLRLGGLSQDSDFGRRSMAQTKSQDLNFDQIRRFRIPQRQTWRAKIGSAKRSRAAASPRRRWPTRSQGSSKSFTASLRSRAFSESNCEVVSMSNFAFFNPSPAPRCMRRLQGRGE